MSRHDFRTQTNQLGHYRFCNRSEFITTETELKAMAAEAIMGLRRPRVAQGMAKVL